MKTHFIVNPRSGGAARALEPVQAFAKRHGASVAITERSRHASELARRAMEENCELIVAVGGDGTMNEVAGALTGTDAVLGLVPCGSGDGLGRHLGIHGPLPHALEIIVSGHARTIDTGMANGHPFFTVAGLGFEAEISSRFNRLTQRGFLRYLTTSARAWRDFKPFECTVEHAGNREQLRLFTLAVANSDQYGNNALIAPGARVDDGLLDLTAVPPVNLLNALPLFSRLFSGSLHAANVTRRQSTHFIVDGLAAGSLLHTDGEIHPAGSRVEFSIRPGSLRVMVSGAASPSRRQ
ncbi:MAG TPA: diacylglycerol kinase family protein [Opitutaceae bacterium]|nr:diacylglycerol kinase family protein [Opitutaceae bacterium]